MIETKINDYVEKALGLEGEHPTKAITITIQGDVDSINPEIIKRIVEGFNVKNFLKHQKAGFDMENDFPLANASEIIAKLFKDAVKEPIVKDTEVIIDPVTKGEIVEESLSDEPEEEPKVDTEGILSFARFKCAEYIKKFNDVYQYNDKFVEELRYLKPDSDILKYANLQQGKKDIPVCVTHMHDEFIKISELIDKLKKKIKIAAPKKKEKLLEIPGVSSLTNAREFKQFLKDNNIRNQYDFNREFLNNPKILERKNLFKGKGSDAKAIASAWKNLDKEFNIPNIRTNDSVKRLLRVYNAGSMEELYHRVTPADIPKIPNMAETLKALEEEKQLSDLYSSNENRFANLPVDTRRRIFDEYGGKDYETTLTKYKDYLNKDIIGGGHNKLEQYISPKDIQEAKDKRPHIIDRYFNKWDAFKKPYAKLVDRVDKTVDYLGTPVIALDKYIQPVVNKSVFANPKDLFAGMLPTSKTLGDLIYKRFIGDAVLEKEYKQRTSDVIEQIKKKTIFENLIKYDDVLKNGDPEKLKNIYETTLSYNPSSLENPEVLRSVLRSSNAVGAEGVDAESATMLAKLERAVKQRYAPIKYED